MKILVISNLYPPEWLGGYELGCSQMVTALARRGHHVTVLTSSHNYSLQAPNLEASPLPSTVTVHRDFFLHDVYRAGLWGGPNKHTMVSARGYCHHNSALLARELDRWRPDIVYLFNTLGLGSAGIISVLDQQQFPWVWHLMDNIPTRMYEIPAISPLLPGKFANGRAVLHGAFIACSRGLVAEINNEGVDLSGSVCVLPNWIDGPIDAIRPYYYQPIRRLRICFVGAIGDFKGVNHIVNGIQLMKQKNAAINLEVDLYGPGDTYPYDKMLQSGGLTSQLCFKGPVERSLLLDLFYKYDLMLFPTWPREPFAFSPMEAASRGCVQAFPYECGNAEWFLDGIDCLKFARNAQGVARLLTDIQKGLFDFAVLANNQARNLHLYFRIDTIAPKVEDFLLRVSAQESRKPKRTPEWSIRFAILAQNLTLARGLG
jgi:glycogen(starch) synthase